MARFHIFLIAFFCLVQTAVAADLRPPTVQAWEQYIRLTEQRVTSELAGGGKFLVLDTLGTSESRSAHEELRSGNVFIRRMETRDSNGNKIPVADGMIHHWLGAIFVPHMTLDFLLHWMQDYDRHERYFKDIDKSRLISRNGDEFKIFMRLRRTKIITVIVDSNHTAVYSRHDQHHASSRSFTTRIAEIDNAGTASEREKPVGKDRGFLWRLNSYWRFVEQEGGVLVECESVSLSRSVPFGFGWIIRQFAQSVPRESLESTLTTIRDESQTARGPEIEAR